MLFFYGLLTAVVFFLCVLTAFYMGYKQGKKVIKPKPLDEVKQRRMDQINKEFQAVFSYDLNTALQRKKV